MSQARKYHKTGEEHEASVNAIGGVDTTVNLYDRAYAELRVAGGIAHASALAVA